MRFIGSLSTRLQTRVCLCFFLCFFPKKVRPFPYSIRGVGGGQPGRSEETQFGELSTAQGGGSKSTQMSFIRSGGTHECQAGRSLKVYCPLEGRSGRCSFAGNPRLLTPRLHGKGKMKMVSLFVCLFVGVGGWAADWGVALLAAG